MSSFSVSNSKSNLLAYSSLAPPTFNIPSLPFIRYRSPAKRSQDGRLSSQIRDTETNEVINDKSYKERSNNFKRTTNKQTFITTSNGIKINRIFRKKDTQPRAETIDRNNKENTNYPQLLLGDSVIPQVLKYLKEYKIKRRLLCRLLRAFVPENRLL